MHQQKTDLENIVGKGGKACNEQFLLFPQCLQLNQITVSPFVHIFEIISSFANEFEGPKTGLSVNGLSYWAESFYYEVVYNQFSWPCCDVLQNYLPINFAIHRFLALNQNAVWSRTLTLYKVVHDPTGCFINPSIELLSFLELSDFLFLRSNLENIWPRTLKILYKCCSWPKEVPCCFWFTLIYFQGPGVGYLVCFTTHLVHVDDPYLTRMFSCWHFDSRCKE